MTEQINITVTDLIPPANIATVDKNALLGNAYDKIQTDAKISTVTTDYNAKIAEVREQVKTDFKGTLKPSTPAPTEDGAYRPEISSELDKPSDPNSTEDWGTIYPNNGNLRAKTGYDTMFYKKGSVWTRVETKMPTAAVSGTFDPSNTKDPAGQKATVDWIYSVDSNDTYGFTTTNYPPLENPLSSYLSDNVEVMDYWGSYEFHKAGKTGIIKNITIRAKELSSCDFVVGDLTDVGFREVHRVSVFLQKDFSNIPVNILIEKDQFLAISNIKGKIDFEPSFSQPVFRRKANSNIGNAVGLIAYSFDVEDFGLYNRTKENLKNKDIFRCNEEALVFDTHNTVVVTKEHFSHISHFKSAGNNSKVADPFSIIEFNTNSNSLIVKLSTLLSLRNENGVTIYINEKFYARPKTTAIDEVQTFTYDLSSFDEVKNVKIVCSTCQRDEGSCVPVSLGFQAGSWATKAAFQMKKKTMVTITDSIGVGVETTLAEQKAYVMMLRDYFKDWSIIPFGFGGAGHISFQQNQGVYHTSACSSADLVTRLNYAFKNASEKVIYIALGTNDASISDIAIKIKSLYQTILASVPDAKIYVQTPVFASGLDLTSIRTTITNIAKSFNLEVFDGMEIFAGNESHLDPIGHPDDIGNAIYFRWFLSKNILG
ncbi:Uncharacterised protein [Chryseobacterium nakagawai]|uniref:SGNH/GDSL hydrolase family protein n=1 Tax=Chryseobacterium nakagawai TaxID=1241982 RepID=A0AAD0YLQ5_CHRNA|nr:SGNH/GDSL hydrolase family protein [Chryseobacterium nakagawai]AZA91122.1 SGNH/GDSL hydrolase family protein [Chryseobacterium nakagawai]VEH22682.1 Uncharacterised protein [Chryseobacterium nakagawai]